MNEQKTFLPLDRIALSLTLGGVVMGVLIAMVGRMIEKDFAMHGYGVFVACLIAAIVLGIITHASPIGKAAVITSSILLVGSLGMLA